MPVFKPFHPGLRLGEVLSDEAFLYSTHKGVSTRLTAVMMEKKSQPWIHLFLTTSLAAYGFIFNEWLFAVTKPSFLNSLSFPLQAMIYFSISAFLTGLCLVGILLLRLLSLVPPLRRNSDWLIRLGSGLPAILFGLLILMLVDNFTYTVFKFGIVSTEGISQAFYGLGFLLVVIFCYWRTLKALSRASQPSRVEKGRANRIALLVAGIVLLSLTFMESLKPETLTAPILPTTGAEKRPNILLITSDGVDADHMSVYGYDRATTPRIQELAKTALVGWVNHSKYLSLLNRMMPTDYALFADEIIKRVADRIRHIFFLRKMVNPYLEVSPDETQMYEPLLDEERFQILRRELQAASQPIFVHVHLMGTHGDKFTPQAQTFSAGQPVETQASWNEDFYDDSILEMDRAIGELVDTLTRLNLLEKTILFIGSDHGYQWAPFKRIPFLMRFPNGQYAGRIRANVQNLDIAPTILDYIGLEQPAWMPGRSLISGEFEQRPIFDVTLTNHGENDTSGGMNFYWDTLDPPFYQFVGVHLAFCQTGYSLDLKTGSLSTRSIEGSTAACLPGEEISEGEAYQIIVEHLKQNDFDVSTLQGAPNGPD